MEKLGGPGEERRGEEREAGAEWGEEGVGGQKGAGRRGRGRGGGGGRTQKGTPPLAAPQADRRREGDTQMNNLLQKCKKNLETLNL